MKQIDLDAAVIASANTENPKILENYINALTMQIYTRERDLEKYCGYYILLLVLYLAIPYFDIKELTIANVKLQEIKNIRLLLLPGLSCLFMMYIFHSTNLYLIKEHYYYLMSNVSIKFVSVQFFLFPFVKINDKIQNKSKMHLLCMTAITIFGFFMMLFGFAMLIVPFLLISIDFGTILKIFRSTASDIEILQQVSSVLAATFSLSSLAFILQAIYIGNARYRHGAK